MKKNIAGVRESWKNFHLGTLSIIPLGSGPWDNLQAMLQETRQNLMTTPLRATGAGWRI